MVSTPSRVHRGVRWSPGTRWGAWAVSLAALALAGTVAVAVAFATALEPAEDFTDSWLLTAAGVAILLSAVASATTGAVAMISRQDRSWPVVTAAFIGGLLTVLSLQQVAEGLGWTSG